MTPKLSICIACYNKAPILPRVLESIFSQKNAPGYEVIVVDDGGWDDTYGVCFKLQSDGMPLSYTRLAPRGYANPSRGRNAAYRLARGHVLVLQSGDVVHVGETLERLADIKPYSFNIATVYNTTDTGVILEQYTGPLVQRPLFFLGSVLRADVLAINGESEDFTEPGFEDNWFSDCLMRGRTHLTPDYRADIEGWHIHHQRIPNLTECESRMRSLYALKVAEAEKHPEKWHGTMF